MILPPTSSQSRSVVMNLPPTSSLQQEWWYKNPSQVAKPRVMDFSLPHAWLSPVRLFLYRTPGNNRTVDDHQACG